VAGGWGPGPHRDEPRHRPPFGAITSVRPAPNTKSHGMTLGTTVTKASSISVSTQKDPQRELRVLLLLASIDRYMSSSTMNSPFIVRVWVSQKNSYTPAVSIVNVIVWVLGAGWMFVKKF